MPIFKYSTFEEARKALWNLHPDASYFKQVAELWNTANKFCPVSYPHGIFKYKNILEANKQRKEWDVINAKTLRL